MAMRYFQTANSLAHGANAMVHIAAAVTDPTALSTLRGASNGWLALKEALNLETDGVKSLYRDTERQLQARLKTPDFHMGETDRAALPQMLIDVRPDLSGLVAGDLNADIILSRMIKSLGDQPYERKEAFENWAKPVLEGLLNNKDLHDVLAPQINRVLLSRLSNLTKNTQEIKADTKKSLPFYARIMALKGWWMTKTRSAKINSKRSVCALIRILIKQTRLTRCVTF